MNPIFHSQLDPKWSTQKLGNTNFNIGRWGCLMTSICILMSKYGSKTTPSDAARKWQFTKDGLLCWNNDFFPLIYKGRYFKYDENMLRSHLKNSGDAVVQVNGVHWLAVDRFSIIGLNCIDPWGGVSCRVKSKYGIPTGMAFFSH